MLLDFFRRRETGIGRLYFLQRFSRKSVFVRGLEHDSGLFRSHFNSESRFLLKTVFQKFDKIMF